MGGSPSDPKNLWPELGGSPNPKDKIENLCHKLVCSGQLGLSEAQKEIATDWQKACGSDVSTNEIPQFTQAPTTQPTSVPIPVTPANPETPSVPVGATGICNDGTYTFAQNHRGACSYHQGVAQWL